METQYDNDDDDDNDLITNRENDPRSGNPNVPQASLPPPSPSGVNASMLLANEIIGGQNTLSRQVTAISGQISVLTAHMVSLSGELDVLTGTVDSLADIFRVTHPATPRPAPTFVKRTFSQAASSGYGYRGGGAGPPLLRGGVASFSSSSAAAASSSASAINLAEAEEEEEERRVAEAEDDGDETVTYSQSSAGSSSYGPSPTVKKRKKSFWTAKERDALEQGVSIFGTGKWETLMAWDAGESGPKALQNRTAGKIKDKWREYEKLEETKNGKNNTTL